MSETKICRELLDSSQAKYDTPEFTCRKAMNQSGIHLLNRKGIIIHKWMSLLIPLLKDCPKWILLLAHLSSDSFFISLCPPHLIYHHWVNILFIAKANRLWYIVCTLGPTLETSKINCWSYYFYRALSFYVLFFLDNSS